MTLAVRRIRQAAGAAWRSMADADDDGIGVIAATGPGVAAIAAAGATVAGGGARSRRGFAGAACVNAICRRRRPPTSTLAALMRARREHPGARARYTTRFRTST